MVDRWERRYRDRPAPETPSAFALDDLSPLLPDPGRALDLAGGAGRHAIWLAGMGWDATLVDVSPGALDIAASRAKRAGVSLETVRSDLTVSAPPEGPWNLILIVHYLHRPLFAAAAERLADGGLLAFSVATVRNLERRERPPLPFLLEEGEAPSLVDDLDVLLYEEGWSTEGRHEVRLIARKPPGADA